VKTEDNNIGAGRFATFVSAADAWEIRQPSPEDPEVQTFGYICEPELPSRPETVRTRGRPVDRNTPGTRD
jgi:hypothetical protein